MTRARTLAGALVLCVLSICAFAAANASAEGLTAVTCEEVGEGHKFTDPHCETSGIGNWETVAVEELKSTEVEGDAVGIVELEATIFGTKIKITCRQAHTTGVLTNKKEGAEYTVHVTEGHSHYTECEAHLASKTTSEEACKIENQSGTSGVGNFGTITTEPLTVTTGKEHKLTYSSPTGGNLAKFRIIKEGVTGLPCSIPTVVLPVVGTVVGIASTEKHSHVTLQGEGTLKVLGLTAQIRGTTHGYMAGEPERTIGFETF